MSNCNKCNKDSYTCGCSSEAVYCTEDMCEQKMDAKCVVYHYKHPERISLLRCLGIKSDTNLEVILEKIDEKLCQAAGLSVQNTNTVELLLPLNVLTSNVRYQNTNSITLSEDANGLKADLKINPASVCAPTVTPDGLLFACNTLTCKAPGDAISFITDLTNYATLKWATNGIAGSTYVIEAYSASSGQFLGNPLSVQEVLLDASYSQEGYLNINYNNILPLLSANDTIRFRVYTICGTNRSDVSSFQQDIGVTGDCPNTSVGFQYNNIRDNTIQITASSINPAVLFYEYKFSVNNVVVVEGISSELITKVVFPASVILKTGDFVELEKRSICSCCISGNSASAWTTSGTIIQVTDCLNGAWTPIPSSSLQSGFSTYNLEYRVKGKELEFRGEVFSNYTSPSSPALAVAHSPATYYTASYSDPLLDISSLNLCGNTLLNFNTDFGIKDTLSKLVGVYSYSSINPTNRHLTTINFNLTRDLSVFNIKRIYTDEHFDASQTSPLSYGVIGSIKDIVISFEGVRISLV
jgi:hypothetical protein